MKEWVEPDEYDARYNNYIMSPEWKAKREQAFLYYGRKCQGCGKVKTLHVHHADYTRLGNEPMADLRILCKRCHTDLHKKGRLKRVWNLREWTDQYIRQKSLPPKQRQKILYRQGRVVYTKKKKLSTGSYCVEDDYLLD